MRLIFLALFGLLPFWIAIGIVVFFAIRDGTHSLHVSHWAIIFSIPASAVTFVIGLVTLGVYEYADGDQLRKVMYALSTLLGLLAVIAWALSPYYLGREKRQAYIRGESAHAAKYLSRHDEVITTVGNVGAINLVATSTPPLSRNQLPSRYFFSIKGTHPARATVAICRRGRVPSFELIDISAEHGEG